MRLHLFLYLILITLLIEGCHKKRVITQKVVQPLYQQIKDPQDIKPIGDTLVDPVIYTQVISLSKLTIPEKKRKFIEMLLPAILVTQHELKQELHRLSQIDEFVTQGGTLTSVDSLFLDGLHKRYKTNNIGELKEKLHTHPASIVLGQAALESGWGTSRFFQQANNIFGIWSYSKGSDRVKALYTRDSVCIFVKKYPNIEESIKDYYGTIARVNAYSEFRKLRSLSKNPYELIPLLDNYSEMGDLYTQKLMSLVKKNQLTLFDSYQINPQFMHEKTIEVR